MFTDTPGLKHVPIPSSSSCLADGHNHAVVLRVVSKLATRSCGFVPAQPESTSGLRASRTRSCVLGYRPAGCVCSVLQRARRALCFVLAVVEILSIFKETPFARFFTKRMFLKMDVLVPDSAPEHRKQFLVQCFCVRACAGP